MLPVDCVIELAHVIVGNLSSKFIQRLFHFWMTHQSLLTNDGDCFIGWKIVTVVFENKEIERRNEPVGRVSGDQVHLLIFESASEKAQIHDAWGSREMQPIGGG